VSPRNEETKVATGLFFFVPTIVGLFYEKQSPPPLVLYKEFHFVSFTFGSVDCDVEPNLHEVEGGARRDDVRVLSFYDTHTHKISEAVQKSLLGYLATYYYFILFLPGECFKPGFDGFVAEADSREDRADIFGSSCGTTTTTTKEKDKK
jgi:hypothetical protein